MTKQFIALLLLSATVFLACNKDDNNSSGLPIPTPTPIPTDVTVTGLRDVTLVRRGDTAAITILITADTGRPRIWLSHYGLPAGVTATFAKGSDRAPFIDVIQLAAGPIAALGATATVELTVSAEATPSSKIYTFRVAIDSDCVADALGTYNVYNGCVGGATANYQCTVTADSPGGRRIYLANFANTGATVYADLRDCKSGQLFMPMQSPPGANFTIYGEGFLKNGIGIYYYITPAGASSSTHCSAAFSR